MNASEVLAAVRRHYGCEHDGETGTEWTSLDEFALAPGISKSAVDLLLVRAWKGKRGHERHAVEVKALTDGKGTCVNCGRPVKVRRPIRPARGVEFAHTTPVETTDRWAGPYGRCYPDDDTPAVLRRYDSAQADVEATVAALVGS